MTTTVLADWIADERAADPTGRRRVVLINRDPEPPAALAGIENAERGDWRSSLSWTALYVFLDEQARVIYVGVTADVARRLREHAETGLADEAAAVVVQWHSLRTLALLAETALIDRHRPRLNRSRDVEPVTRGQHLAVLHTPTGSGVHPVEDDLRGESEGPRTPWRGQRVTCWHCAPERVLATTLAGRSRSSFDPWRRRALCYCTRTDLEETAR